MRIVLQNGHESPMELRAAVFLSMAPGDELVVDWTWTGVAALTCGPGWLALSGAAEVTAPGPDVQDLWHSTPVPGDEVHEFGIHNATGESLNTFWEPWCGEGEIPAGAGPVRAEWTADSAGAGLVYQPGQLVVWDTRGSFRAWLPDGQEIFTGGMPLSCPDPAGTPLPGPDPAGTHPSGPDPAGQ
ncbi:MAG TPA: hypothetical protein VN408_28005 [Actinoplanes sp.]|nr:hypothetical protein [Actinoplanes sp.]